MSVESHGHTDTGCVRAENQDRILLHPALGLYAVCDGMGGHQRGELAAEMAGDALHYYIDLSRDGFDITWPFGFNNDLSIDANRLLTSIKLANRQVWRRAEQALEYAGMGTTVAAVLLNDTGFVAGNVGDSRIYLFRDGRMTQLSIDDTMCGNLTERGLLTPDELRAHPLRNVLTQAAGSGESIGVHICEEALRGEDVVLLCSDGLHGVIDETMIRSILSCGDSVDRATGRLIHAAREAGAPDNVSVVLLRYSE